VPIVHVTPLGSNASGADAAIGQIIQYLERGSKVPQPNASPAAYYADSAEGPGLWRGRGVGGEQLHGVVDPEVLREILSGRHPKSGAQLVTATGSAGRAQKDRPQVVVAPLGPPDELLSTEQVAALVGTSERYIRKVAIDSRRAEATDGAAINRPARLQGIQLESGAWAFRRNGVERFAATREEPKVVVAYDVTISVEKSISLAWVHADPAQRKIIEQGIDAGVNAAIAYLEDHALQVRRGRGSESADGVWAASYRHLTNRHLEPQLHEHVLIANVAAPLAPHANGQRPTQAIDARGLMHHAKTAGYVAGAVIRNHLSTHLGLEWNPVERGLSDLAHVPRTVIEAMSTRRQEVTSVATELGLDSLKARQYAAQSTRTAKQHPTDWDALEAGWQQTLTSIGFTKHDWLQLTDPARRKVAALTPRDIDDLTTWLHSPDGVTRRNGIFGRRDVVQHLIDHDAAHGSNRLTAELVDRLADNWLTSPNVVAVAVPAHQQARTGETRWYTTTAVLALEHDVITAYLDGQKLLVAAAKPETVTAAINTWQTATGHTLGDDQSAMVRQITTSTDHYSVVVGPAGTGKTASLEVAARAWEHHGLKALGVAVTGSAADQLAAATGIPTRTVASLLHALDHGQTLLDARTVLIVDEASTLSNRDHHALIRAVQTVGARMVAVGDPAQHGAVEAGGLWAHLVDELGDHVARLDTNRRQTAPDMTEVRLANAEYREGRIAVALQRLVNDQRIVTASTAVELLDELAADWYLDHQQQLASGDRPSRMMAEHHSVRHQLNQRAQALLIADGTLEGPGTRIGDAILHVGDEVVTRTRHAELRFEDGRRLRNGTHGTVKAIDLDPSGRAQVTVDFHDRGSLVLDHEFLSAQIRAGIVGGLTPAYAVTTHIAQGATYRAGRVVATDTSTREGTYVGLTRGTTDTRVYAVRRTDLEPAERSDLGLPSIPDVRTTIDALTDQLTKQPEATIASISDPDAARIHELTKLRLPDLRLQAVHDAEARQAIELVALRIGSRTINSPSPQLVDRLGPRPPANDPMRSRWDHAVRTIIDVETRYGTAMLPPNASERQGRDHAAMTRAVEPLEAVQSPRREIRTLADELATARSKLPIDERTIERVEAALEPHIAAAVASPARHLIDVLGRRPTSEDEGLQWDIAAEAIERWRHHNGLTPHDKSDLLDPMARALGPEPSEQNLEYELAVDAIDESRRGPIDLEAPRFKL
jgi:conjugative relaxase-like TrwC/TraI family protein